VYEDFCRPGYVIDAPPDQVPSVMWSDVRQSGVRIPVSVSLLT
jgi:hypothetical protein